MRHAVPSTIVSLIKEMFPDCARQNTDPTAPPVTLEAGVSPRVSAIVELVKDIPDHLINLEGQTYTVFVMSLRILDAAVRTWETQGSRFPLTKVPGLTQANPMTLLLRTLEQCPDEYPPPSVAELVFIRDEEFRRDLRMDIHAMERAVAASDWKAGTVLGGSIVEALLLWKIRQSSGDKVESVNKILQQSNENFKGVNKLDSWHLEQYIKVAEKLDLISETSSKLAALSKDFRNLVHPGRSVRLQQKCNRGTALTVLATVVRLIDELSARSV